MHGKNSQTEKFAIQKNFRVYKFAEGKIYDEKNLRGKISWKYKFAGLNIPHEKNLLSEKFVVRQIHGIKDYCCQKIVG